MKKIIIIACLIITLSINITCFAFDDINDTNTANAVDTLSKYSIINGYEDGTFRPNNTITRAEFAKIVVATANLYYMVDNAIRFEDTQSHWAEEYINLARHKGIINGTSDTTFDPDSNITYEQAIKMIVCMLGYGDEAKTKGGYPEGYISVGSALGLTEELYFSNTDYAKRGDIAMMIYNALDVRYIVTDVNGNVVDDMVEELTLRKIHEDLLEFNS